MPLHETDTITRVKLEKPRMYKVVLHNDDFTPQHFVVDILVNLFQKSEAEAYNLMMQVHKNNKGVAGTYSKEIAEHKVFEVDALAKHEQHPLKTTAEPE